MEQMKKVTKTLRLIDQYLPFIYWLLPLLSWLIYMWYMSRTMNQIRYEELAETIRNVYWFKQGKIYDYISHNIGMYWVLLQWYKLVGFSLFAGKWLFLGVALMSNYALAGILKKLAEYKWVVIPMLTILLSPTRMYFTAMQVQYGIDLLYLPILIFLLMLVFHKNKTLAHISNLLFWFVLVVATFSYSVFMFYVPILVVTYGGLIYKRKISKDFLLSALGGIFLSLMPLWSLIEKYELLNFYARMLTAMQTTPYSPTIEGVMTNMTTLAGDFLYKANSYNYELFQVDFSYFLPIITLVGVLWVGLKMWQERLNRNILLVLAAIVVFNLYVVVIKNAPITNPGMRRLTPLLFSIYTLYALSWISLPKLKMISKKTKQVLLGLLLILPAHHLLVLPQNMITATDASRYEYQHWFMTDKVDSPKAIIDRHVDEIRDKDLYFTCESFEGQATYKCRYPEVYSAIKLQCELNGLKCGRVWGYDPKSKEYVQLDPVIWEGGYWEH